MTSPAAQDGLAAVTVDPAVLALRPDYMAVVLVVENLRGGPSDDAGVTCRRWNWRQCTRTRLTEATTRAFFVLDGLDPLGVDGTVAAAGALHRALETVSPGVVVERRVIAGS